LTTTPSIDARAAAGSRFLNRNSCASFASTRITAAPNCAVLDASSPNTRKCFPINSNARFAPELSNTYNPVSFPFTFTGTLTMHLSATSFNFEITHARLTPAYSAASDNPFSTESLTTSSCIHFRATLSDIPTSLADCPIFFPSINAAVNNFFFRGCP
jgi:hypothetical protein